ncbi:hypothetical protein Glove_2g62 [Diversispora epigaea]|uniref:Uncharacterized protein n=1 Tax=Diversispora epigaea TaxID=1348612 RepID=A0A397JS54_9GLOM|nr:hypothetical protein Glove_2g62 [Diversispora epigaea]
MNYIRNFLIPENNNNQEEEQEETPLLELEETRERASTLPPKKNKPRNQEHQHLHIEDLEEYRTITLEKRENGEQVEITDFEPERLGNRFQEQEHPQQEQLERKRIQRLREQQRQTRIDLPDFTLLTTSPRCRNRPLTVAGLSQTQPIVNPTPRAREELVPHIIHITEEDKQVISAQEILVI